MPFMGVDYPSIQLGLLKAIAEAHGFPVRTLHANLGFAARVGIDYYRELSEHRGLLIGEWLFSLEAFGNTAPDADSSLLDVFANRLPYLKNLRTNCENCCSERGSTTFPRILTHS